MTKPVRKPTEPLRTRHVFLDTEVYRRAGFNISNTPFTLLAQEIERGRIVLQRKPYSRRRRRRNGWPGTSIGLPKSADATTSP